MLNYIDFEDKQEVKDFILNTLIKKEQLLDEIAVLNEEIKAEKKSSNRWVELYLETSEENTTLKKELEQIKSGTQEERK